MQMSNISVITLSDSESEDETAKESKIVTVNSEPEISIIDLDACETAHNESGSAIPVITLDDSMPAVNSGSKISFKVDRMPDFIPICVKSRSESRKRVKKRKNGCIKWSIPVTPEQTGPPEKKKKTQELGANERKVDTNGNKISKKLKKKMKKAQELHANENVESRNEECLITRTIQLSHPNTFCTKPLPFSNLRPIVIDGCNVACGYGKGTFCAEGIICVIQYFLNRHHEEIVCFIPQNYRNRLRTAATDAVIADYEKRNIIVYTPSRWVNGKQITPYDDRFILQYASERQGVIISNDKYLDLFNEEPSWQSTIEKRIVNFTFARGMFMLPKDPLGRNGPTLDEVLRFP